MSLGLEKMSLAPSDGLTEQDWLKLILGDDQKAFGTTKPDSEASAAASHKRGVKIGWLIEFTNKHNCWDWPVIEDEGRWGSHPIPAHCCPPCSASRTH